MKSFEEVKNGAKQKLDEAGRRLKRGWNNTVLWCEQHREFAIAMIPVGIAIVKGIGGTVKSIDRKIDLRKEQELKELYVYDQSAGQYHKLRRPMRPSEKIEFADRLANGEKKVKILASMGLLD